MKNRNKYIPGKKLTGSDRTSRHTVKSKTVKAQGAIQLFFRQYGRPIVLVLLAVMIAVTGIIGGAMVGYIKTATPITREQLMSSRFTTQVYDRNNQLVSELYQYENREWVNYDSVPDYVGEALVAIEDERFLKHEGVDVPGLFRAVFKKILNPGNQMAGASTITMQVIKNVTGDDKRSLRRKVQEWWRAMELEKNLEKWEILENYMNIIVTGINIYGVQAAAKTYFGKNASQLTLAEAASIAGITNNPGLYTPTTTKGRENNKNRQMDVLDKMLELGMIEKTEYDAAVKEELRFVNQAVEVTVNSGSQSYFVDQVVLDIKKEFMQQGLSEAAALDKIYNGGLKIYTTLDNEMQKILDQVFQDSSNFPVTEPGNPHAQASMVVLDANTAQIRALYGGYGPKTTNSLNRATQIERQPGSVMKPIAVYGPALNERAVTAATVLDDSPVYMLGTDEDPYPMNYDKAYHGLVTVRDAVKFSYNVPAAIVFDEWLGAEKSLQYLKKVGINRDQREVSLALGGMNQGISPLQAAAAFVPFVKKGLYYPPTTLVRVEDHFGNVVIEKKTPRQTIVYDETAAYIMNTILQDVCISGTASILGQIANAQGQIIPTGGKTGTTNDTRDSWFVGFSAYYVGAVWYGYDKNTPIPQGPEWTVALNLWNRSMSQIHANLQPVAFQSPSGLVKRDICMRSGKLATATCAQDPMNPALGINYAPIRTELFISGTEPKDKCDVHITRKVCTVFKDGFGRALPAGPNCPASAVETRVLIQRPYKYVIYKDTDPFPFDLSFGLGENTCNHDSPAGNGPAASSPASGTGTATAVQAGETPVKTVSPSQSPAKTTPAKTE